MALNLLDLLYLEDDYCKIPYEYIMQTLKRATSYLYLPDEKMAKERNAERNEKEGELNFLLAKRLKDMRQSNPTQLVVDRTIFPFLEAM